MLSALWPCRLECPPGVQISRKRTASDAAVTRNQCQGGQAPQPRGSKTRELHGRTLSSTFRNFIPLAVRS